MSRHEAVSCDSCLKGNFRGRRYKCLICYDYDLCAVCFENGATTTRHTAEHPMQCILTRSDFDLYYGGEAVTLEQPQSFTCPFCGKMGYTESTLQEHVTSEHSESLLEVVCPVCAASTGGDPNHVTDDFAAHLTLEHRSPRDLDETGNVRHLRRMFHPGRGIGQRTRRPNMHFSGSSGLSSGQSSSSPSSRETMDPIAELLSQLSGTRRAAGHDSTASQLQQLQIMQLQLERQQQQQSQQGTARQQVERLAVPRRQTNAATAASAAAAAASSNSNPGHGASSSSLGVAESSMSSSSLQKDSQFLLSRIQEPVLTETEQQSLEVDNADRSFFLQDLILSTLNDDYYTEEPDETVIEGAIGGTIEFEPAETLLQLESLHIKDKERPV
ncbi:E3 ubiquitin-protein ligase KCMF1-like [Asterias rubens]|uniref:E3 ubiquitin-protein ligase KCMF1-like n=1 Tax=Asterias rubens TaxID=7604 RepID=UPI001455843B|nr:E3 ubiquitin-protein ligase KCMF1-like [Asterias rubens]